jgi:hypothetical protein
MLGLPPAEAQALIRKTVEACEGHVGHAAELLGVPISTLSKKLNHRPLLAWWTHLREKRMLERVRARRRREYLARKTRALIAEGHDPETAAALAAIPYTRTGFRTGRRER